MRILLTGKNGQVGFELQRALSVLGADYPLPAKPPANSRLECTRFKQTFGLELPHWQLGLQHILTSIL